MALVPAVLSFCIYLPTLTYKYTYDDSFSILANPVVSNPNMPLSSIMYRDFWGNVMEDNTDGEGWTHRSWRPIPTLIYRFVFQWADYNSTGAAAAAAAPILHTVNVILHSVNTFGVHVAVKRLVTVLGGDKAGSSKDGSSKAGSKVSTDFYLPHVTSLLFSLHPVHVEAVANITHGTELLSACFILCAIIVYLSNPTTITVQTVAATSLLTVLASLCKETAFMLFPLLIVLNAKILPRTNHTRASSFFTVATAALLAARFKASSGMAFAMDPEFNPLLQVKAPSQEWCAMVGYAHFDVAKLLFDPFTSIYSFDRVPDPTSLLASWSLGAKCCVMYGAFGALVLSSWRKSGNARYSLRSNLHSKITLLTTCAFASFFLPASQLLFPNGFFVAERTLYIPSIFTCLFVAQFPARFLLAKKPTSSKTAGIQLVRREAAVKLCLVLVCAACSYRTATVEEQWRDEYNLYSTTLKNGWTSYNSYRGLGHYFYEAERLQDSMDMYDKTVEEKTEKGLQPLLADYAMVGRVRLHYFMGGSLAEGTEEYARVVGRAKEALELASGGYHYMQVRSTHDEAMLLWFTCCNHYVDERNVGELTRATMMLTQVVDHIDKFPTLSARNIAMLRNNAACAEMLYYMSQKKGSDGQAGYKLEEVVKNLDAAMGQVGIEEGAYLSYASNKVLAYLAASREGGKGELEIAEGELERAEGELERMVRRNEGEEIQRGNVDTVGLRRLLEGVRRGEEGVDLRVCIFDWTK